jgi:hypothetical protein
VMEEPWKQRKRLITEADTIKCGGTKSLIDFLFYKSNFH